MKTYPPTLADLKPYPRRLSRGRHGRAVGPFAIGRQFDGLIPIVRCLGRGRNRRYVLSAGGVMIAQPPQAVLDYKDRNFGRYPIAFLKTRFLGETLPAAL
jgi:hypothetical protein